MSNTLHLTATVLPGNRIEVPTPDFQVGETLDVVVTARQTSSNGTGKPNALLEFLDALPPNRRTAEEWEQFDRDFKEEKRSWVL